MKISNVFNTILLFLFSILIVSCTLVEHDDQTAEGNNFGYETNAVSNILNGSCATSGCHSSAAPTNGLSTELQSELLNGSTQRQANNGEFYGGDVVIPFNTDKSLLMQFVEGNITSQLSYNHKILTGTQIATISNWIEDGAKNYLNAVPFQTPESYRVYVCNSGSENVSTIDGAKNVVSRIVDINNISSQQFSPYWVAENGDYYYVTSNNGNALLKIRKSDNSIVNSTLNISSAGMVKINSAGTKVYVSRAYDSTSTYSSIYVVNPQDMSIIKTINFPFNGLLHGLALDENRGYLYVADAINNLIYIINIQNDTIIDNRFSLTQDYYPLFIEVSPDGNYLYLSSTNTNQLLVFDAGNRSVVSTIPLLLNPTDIAISNNGSKIFIASNGGNAIEVVTKTNVFWNKTNTITHSTMSNPYALDITGDGNYLYATNYNGNGDFVPTYQVKGEGNISTVSIININSESIEKVIEVEENAIGIAIEK
jgi:YVTN family beta-propeller protein